MDSMTKNKKMRLGDNTKSNITNKLNTLRKTEEELRKSFVNIIKRAQLYQASRGHINAFGIDDDNTFAKVLSKHSNLLNLSSAYNKKAINLIDLFQTISTAILGKIDGSNTSSGTNSEYERPITMGYNTTYGQKKNVV